MRSYTLPPFAPYPYDGWASAAQSPYHCESGMYLHIELCLWSYLTEPELYAANPHHSGLRRHRIAASVFADLWVPCVVFSLLFAALITGILKLIAAASISNTLMISLVWVVYNMIPQYLLIHYTWVGRGGSLRVINFSPPPPPSHSTPSLISCLNNHHICYFLRMYAGPLTL